MNRCGTCNCCGGYAYDLHANGTCQSCSEWAEEVVAAEADRRRERDEVLIAFHTACPRPSASDIIHWTTQHPQFADDIRDHAAISRDLAANEHRARVEINEQMLARGRVRALEAIRSMEARRA